MAPSAPTCRCQPRNPVALRALVSMPGSYPTAPRACARGAWVRGIRGPAQDAASSPHPQAALGAVDGDGRSLAGWRGAHIVALHVAHDADLPVRGSRVV